MSAPPNLDKPVMEQNEHAIDQVRTTDTDLLDDPHVAAFEDNPDVVEKPSWSTMLAVLVGVLTGSKILVKR
jgi:hypothetical protein